MKGVNERMLKFNFRKRAVFICLIAMLFAVLLPSAVLAEESGEENTFQVAENAGEAGYYQYNVWTSEETYIPPSEIATLQESDEPIIVPQEFGSQEVAEAEYTEYFEEDVGELRRPNSWSGIEPFGIIGGYDNRTPVGYVTSRFQTTCLIVACYPDGSKAFGTGFLVTDRHVLTAGHLAYDRNAGGYATHFAVYAGSNDGTYKKYSLAHYYRVGGNYVAYDDIDDERASYDDWAVITCDSSMGLGHMGWISTNSAEDMVPYNENPYWTQGYPLDKNVERFGNYTDNTELIKYEMYVAPGTVLGNMYDLGPSKLVSVTFDVDYGQSGSPIYRYVSGAGYCVQAMIITGGDDKAAISEYNVAILINSRIISAIREAEANT